MPRLLFVDDTPNDFLIWGRPLATDHGWDVRHAGGVEEALAALEEAPFDVAIIDRQMPDPELAYTKRDDMGDDLLEDVIARWPYVCPIMLTVITDIKAAQHATRHGAYRYLVKGVEVKELDRVCRRGMQMQRVKQTRHELVASGCVERIVAQVKRCVADLFNPPDYCFAYLQIVPGGSLLLADSEGDVESETLAEARQNRGAFVQDFPCAEEVVKRQRYRLRTKRKAIPPDAGTLIDGPGSQLIVPVLQPQDPADPKCNATVALIWVESQEEDTFDHDDAEILQQLADYVALALNTTKRLEQRSESAHEDERDGLLSLVAHRICNPLQIAQSSLDMVVARLRRRDEIPPDELRDQLAASLDGLEGGIQAARQLRQGAGPRPLTLQLVDLAPLVTEIVGSFTSRAQAAGCEIHADISPVGPPVMLDQSEMRYVLNCLLDNAVEAIERRRSQGDGPLEAQIHVDLRADRSQRKTVMLSVRDNGIGIPQNDLLRVFDRYFTTKGGDTGKGKRGLGLWEAKRFIESKQVKGSIEALIIASGGTRFNICLPAARVKPGSPEEATA